ncbi:MAG: DNA translocase FtsK [Anaerolineales bacterium]|nr:DNA translocase FtsK [Anaerolineales bacterium]
MPSKSRKSPTPPPTAARPDHPPAEDWLDQLARFQAHFGRFAWDVVGVLLLALALMVFLGLLGISGGRLLSLLVGLLKLWFGWGSILIIIAACLGGLLAFRRSRGAVQLNWGQVIAIEIAAFLTLAVLSVLGGNSLPQAEAGWWGGRVGWGLAMLLVRYLGSFWGAALIFLFWGLAALTGLGLWRRLEAYLIRQAGEPLATDLQPATAEDAAISSSAGSTSTLQPRGKKNGERLPPEFRKAFKVPDRQDDRPAEPPPRGERLPPLNLLVNEQSARPDERNINQTAGLIEKTLSDFGIPARVVGFRIGPTVTQFAIEPGFFEKGDPDNGDPNRQKVRVAQIANLSRDLALALSADRLRIEAPVPGRSYVGIEVPNLRSVVVRLRPILEAEAFYRVGSPLAIALGRDVSGQPVVADLAKMPHLLIAGTTGSGKSVCISAIIACLAMNNTPEDLRLVLIDSKMVELIRFNGLSHLYGKVESDVQRILGVLRWIVVEMEHRYKLLEAAKARDIEAYNRKLQRRKDTPPLPRIVVLIDELADLMMSAPDQTEHNLVRLAQMARATGIHLVVATQRPSMDVVTGLIKANFPARISFAVASQVDSRVILDMPGADTLLGRGDMLFLNPEVGKPLRAQGVMVTDQEVERIIAFWQKMNPAQDVRPPWEALLSQPEGDSDEVLIEQAITVLKQEQRASASLLQRRLRIGYPRAARLLDQLEEMGVVGSARGGGREREVLLEPDEENGESAG